MSYEKLTTIFQCYQPVCNEKYLPKCTEVRFCQFPFQWAKYYDLNYYFDFAVCADSVCPPQCLSEKTSQRFHISKDVSIKSCRKFVEQTSRIHARMA